MDLKQARRRIISSDAYRFTRLRIDDIEKGSWGYSKKQSSSKRLRSKILYAVKTGDKLIYTNPSFKFYSGVLSTKTDTSYHGHSTGWQAAGQVKKEYTSPADGYITIVLETPDGSAAVLEKYDCIIDIMRNN